MVRDHPTSSASLPPRSGSGHQPSHRVFRQSSRQMDPESRRVSTRRRPGAEDFFHLDRPLPQLLPIGAPPIGQTPREFWRDLHVNPGFLRAPPFTHNISPNVSSVRCEIAPAGVKSNQGLPGSPYVQSTIPGCRSLGPASTSARRAEGDVEAQDVDDVDGEELMHGG